MQRIIEEVRAATPMEAEKLLRELLSAAKDKRRLARFYSTVAMIKNMEGRNTAFLASARCVVDTLGVSEDDYQRLVAEYADEDVSA